MGMFFNNLHIRKNELFHMEQLQELLISDMTEKGCTLQKNAEDAGVSLVIYAPEGSEWVSVASEFFQFDSANDTQAAAAPLSGRFGTDVIAAACNDSDFLFLHLLNTADGTDGWINAGHFYSAPPRRTKLSPWKSKVTDFAALQAITKETPVFAEEVFFTAAPLLGMQPGQCSLTPGFTEELDAAAVTKLYFSLPEGNEKALPKLRMPTFDPTPCRIGGSKCIFVNNYGGRSEGIAVMFTGDFIEHDELTFENVTFESDYGSPKRKIIPITPEKRKTQNGETILYWEDRHFSIPPAISSSIPEIRRMQLAFEKSFGVRFTVQGDPERAKEVKVYILPLENYQKGGICWSAGEEGRQRFIRDFTG